MANDGQIVFEVRADGKNARADIKAITKEIETETRKWDKSVDSASNDMTKSMSRAFDINRIKTWALQAGKALMDFGKEAIQAASDLQEVQNVVDATFGNNANQIEAWAKKAGTQFGLTETQAKRFTSTLGAMMKSAGMAGDEIVEMSTDMSGLAADMASFYNLDFDTAFQKIRSGISGETEPLKQLGINMSVANLNAYALQKGLEKTFEQMSQGEQTMLRYQYLMSATADAQGDFARTSDGYANTLRQMETNLETFKTNVGKNFVEPMAWVVEKINSLFGGGEEEGGAKRVTVLDKLADIDVQTQEAIAKAEETKRVVGSLTTSLEEIGQKNTLLENATGNVTAAVSGLNGLAVELSKVKIEGDAKEAFESTLAVLYNNVENLSAITGDDASGVKTFLDGVREKAQGLTPGDVTAWTSLRQELETNFPGLADAQKAADGVKKLSEELSQIDVSGGAESAFNQTLETLHANIDALSTIRGEDADGVKTWLEEVKAGANGLGAEDAQAWVTLLGALVQDIPDVNGEDGGSSLMEKLTAYYLSLGSGSEEAATGLAALGYSTDEIQEKQREWLATCRELVSAMPGLSSIIDTNTGEVKGGTQAIKDYADEWERMVKYEAQIKGLREKQALYEGLPEQSDLKADVNSAYAKAKAYLVGYGKLTDEMADKVLAGAQAVADAAYKGLFGADNPLDDYGILDYSSLKNDPSLAYKMFYGGQSFSGGWIDFGYDALAKADPALAEYMEKLWDYYEFIEVQPAMIEAYNDAIEQTAEDYGITTDVVNESIEAQKRAEAITKANAEAMETLQKHAVSAAEALQNMYDYVAASREAAIQSLNSVAKGLEDVDYKNYGDQIERRKTALEQLVGEKDEKKIAELKATVAEINKTLITPASMLNNLDSQKTFLSEYLANLKEAQGMDLSNELLAALSDGSAQSAEMLAALVSDKEAAKLINEQYLEIQKMKEELGGVLSNQQLTIDETYAKLAEKAKEAVAELNQSQTAESNTAATIQAISDGITEKTPEVQAAIDAILAQLNRLNGWGINIDFGGFGVISLTTSSGKTEGSGRMGIDFVPHDDYLARLHEGERVLTAQENQIWNALRGGAIAGFDLDALGGVMRDNVKAGGNVYLDGRVVGSVISDIQGKSYRQLQRSGWQS